MKREENIDRAEAELRARLEAIIPQNLDHLSIDEIEKLAGRVGKEVKSAVEVEMVEAAL